MLEHGVGITRMLDSICDATSWGRFVHHHGIVRRMREPEPSKAPGDEAVSTPPAFAALSSEKLLDALKMILMGTSLEDVLTSIARLIEAHSNGMLCSIFLVEEDGLHLRYAA